MENITIAQIVSGISIVSIIGGALITIFKFGFKYENRFIKIESRLDNLEEKSTINEEENRIMIKGLLACLKGLKEQGCNGSVTQSIHEIEEYLIKNNLQVKKLDVL